MIQSTSHPSLQKLTEEQKETYHKEGYVVIPDFFPKKEVAAINDEIDRLRRKPGERDTTHAIFQLGLRSDITRSLCEDERILTLIEDLVHPGIAIYSAKMVEKPPHSSLVCHWHQDDAYYQKLSLSDTRMSIWIPLQDCNEENGCVWVVPQSHLKGLREHEMRAKMHCGLSFAEGHEEVPGAIPCPIRAGNVLLFHALTWHRSLGNQTDQYRRSFIISYQDALATRGNGAQHKILRPAS